LVAGDRCCHDDQQHHQHDHFAHDNDSDDENIGKLIKVRLIFSSFSLLSKLRSLNHAQVWKWFNISARATLTRLPGDELQ